MVNWSEPLLHGFDDEELRSARLIAIDRIGHVVALWLSDEEEESLIVCNEHGDWSHSKGYVRNKPPEPETAIRALDGSEMHMLVGQAVKRHDSGVVQLVLAVEPKVSEAKLSIDAWHSAQHLLDNYVFLDGKPVGIEELRDADR